MADPHPAPAAASAAASAQNAANAPTVMPTPIALATVEAMVLANGWAGAAHLDRLRPMVKDGRQLMKALVDQHIAPPESLAQFDLLLHLQNQLSEFSILKKLGAGGMGTVYLATHHLTGGEVAIKVISARLAGDSEFLGRFHRETQALIGLHHPHLANIIASGSAGSTHYLAMDHINGPSLAALLKEYRALPDDYVLRLMRQVTDCLQYVYSSAGLVHRDVKPENILIQRQPGTTELFPSDDEAKLIDFGLVKSANDDEHLTQTGMTIGTPLYMSPEQVRGEKLDCRSDIYGLGATIFHLLTGSPPFKGTSPGAIMSAHLTDPVPDPGSLVPSLSPATRRLVTTAMAKKAADRFVNFDALLKAFDAAAAEMSERGGGAIKFLRKPLVIQNKKPPGSTSGSPAAATPKKPAPVALPELGPAPDGALGERIQRKNAERKARESGRISLNGESGVAHAGSHAAHTPAPSSPVTAALVRIHTDRAKKNIKSLPKASAVAEPDLTRSAAFAEETATQSGTGALPWIFLSAAVAIAVGYLIFWLRGG